MDRSVFRRALLAAAVGVVLTTACIGPGGNPGGFGTITGRVTRSPTCPGPQRPGQVCTAPVAGVTVTARLSERGSATAITDAGGIFVIRMIATGPVTLIVDPVAAGAMACDSPTVTPTAAATVRQDISCDTGIR